MAGRNAGFSAGEFRSAIRFVYEMAAAPLEAEQATFYGESTLVYAGSVDDDAIGFNPASTVVRQPAVGVRVPCGIEYFDSQGETVVFGTIAPSRVVITLLDQEYVLVKDSAYVVLGGDKYLYRRTEPPTGLFDVGLYAMTFVAENET